MSPSKLGETHYIPHQSIIQDDKTATKIRIVFDASTRDNRPSLNYCLYKGPHIGVTFCLNETVRKHVQGNDFVKEFTDKVLSSFVVDDFT